MCDNIPLNADEEQFVQFLEYFSNFYNEAYKIAENNKGKSILPTDHTDRNKFKMYSLDDICHSCSIFKDGDLLFTPKTTDAIWYKKCNDDFYIFLIEFKGDYLCKKSSKCSLVDVLDTLKIKNETYNSEFSNEIKIMDKIVKKYSDKMLNGLASKPLETVTISIPLIYEEYYEKNKDNENVNFIDIRNFLRKSKIVYRVVSISDKKEKNRFKNRGNAVRCSNMIPAACRKYAQSEDDEETISSYESSLKTYYKRYEKAGIINYYDFIENINFNNFIINYLK